MQWGLKVKSIARQKSFIKTQLPLQGTQNVLSALEECLEFRTQSRRRLDSDNDVDMTDAQCYQRSDNGGDWVDRIKGEKVLDVCNKALNEEYKLLGLMTDEQKDDVIPEQYLVP